MTTQEPLRAGEIVTLEKTIDYDNARLTTRVEGELREMSPTGTLFLAGRYIARNGGDWTIVSRRDPEPEWADADAILVRYKDGNTAVYAAGELSFLPFWAKRSADRDIESIKGLYLRPTDD